MSRPFALLVALAALWLAPFGGLAAAAAPSALVPSETVRYDAVELRSDAGVANLYQRLEQAARRSCQSLPGIDRWTETARSRCQEDSLEAAIRQARQARLTALHRACQRDVAGSRCPRPAAAGRAGRRDSATS